MRADARKNYEQLLAVGRELVRERGADASLRDVARRAGVGNGTLHRHFPTREALLEALLRTSFDALAARADELAASASADTALIDWLREAVSVAHDYSGAIASMVAAIADESSVLHASCVTMRAAGARLLADAQARGLARTDMDGADLFALVGALAWVADQPSLAGRSDRIFGMMAGAILTDPARSRSLVDGR